MTRRGDAPAATGGVNKGETLTTAGLVALVNLQAQIAGMDQAAAAGGLDVSARAELIELITLRGHVLGCIRDYELAQALSEQLTRDAPGDGVSLLAHARAAATFHQFTNALTDLEAAQRLGADPAAVDLERAAILQAVGQYDQALAIYRENAEWRADFYSLGALATFHAERGEIIAAERFFSESRRRYRRVSPFPLAQLDYRRGLMWLMQGDLDCARTWFATALDRLPGYAPAQGHLAEVESAQGESESAIARLRPLTISSDDPQYAASLARILNKVGRLEEAREWRVRAAARYDELLERHFEAFASHAAEFRLEKGAAPPRENGVVSIKRG